MDDKLTAEILATCDSLGYADKDKYYKDYNCLECVKDLLLYLRRDDEDHTIRRLLGKAQVVQRDLLPLLKHYSEDLELSDLVLRLLMTLTCPVFLLYRQEIPKNKKYLSYYLQIEQHLRNYKAAFVDKLLWKRLTDRMRHLLNLEWDKCMESDKQTLERILVLIRDILTVPADPAEEKRTDDEHSLHDRVVMVMHLSGIEDLLLYVASSETTREYCLHVLEIISVMLREQTGEQIAKTQLTRNEDEKVKDERELIKIREKEAVFRSIQVKKFSTRHSRFGGTFMVRDIKAPSGRDLLCHKPITSTADLSLDSTKKTKRTASNRMPMKEDDPTRRSTIPIRIILKEFCVEFLDGAYNSIMRVVKDSINRGSTAEHDETYYLWAMKFFMEFNRYHKFRVSYVSETMSTTSFHYVQTLLDNYHGMMVTDKEKIPFWSKRAHMALNAYQELLYTLLWMDNYGDESVKESSRIIKSNVFYLPEYRELCFGLLNTYDQVKLSKLYLKDLVETNHLFLKMLEDFATSTRRIIVKTKGKKRKKTKNSKKTKKSRRGTSKNVEELEELWTTISVKVSSALLSIESPDGEIGADTGLEDVNVIPFDAVSDIPIDEQKVTAVERIAVFLHTGKYKAAAALFRASREVWPESTEEFGEPGIDASDEISVLKSIFVEKVSLPAVSSALREIEEAPSDEEALEENEEEYEEEEEEVRVASKEQEFDFFGFVLKYATPKIVCNYAMLFKEWESLKPFALHCIMKMFHRFIFQMDYPALICQASIFRTFQKILQIADRQPDLKEVSKFFYHFWPKFAKLCNDKKMFVEILFWKTAKEAQEIQDGYGSHLGTAPTKPSKFSWTTEEDNEFVLLAEEYKVLPDEAKRATKMVDWIRERWTWQPKSKKVMMNKLVEKGLIHNTIKTRRPPKTWQDEEIARLKELYDEFKESTDVMSNILERMEIKRSRNSVILKMIEIQLIRDKSEVKKKRVRGQRKKRNQSGPPTSDAEGEHLDAPTSRRSSVSSSGSESSSDSESDDSDKENDAAQSSSTTHLLDKVKSLKFGKDLVTAGSIGPLKWVMQSLKYFLDDLCDEPDSDENVPLVPIGSDCISAISNSNMKAFLKSLGLHPPGVQETFWRIPGAWGQNDVKARIETLEQIVTVDTVPISSTNSNRSDDNDSLSNDVPRSRVKTSDLNGEDSDSGRPIIDMSQGSPIQADSNKHRQKSRITSDTDSSDDHSSKANISQITGNTKSLLSQGSTLSESNKSYRKSRIASDTDSSDDGSASSSCLPDKQSQTLVNGRKNRSRIVVESDSENDDVTNQMNVDNSPEKVLKQSKIDSDDDEPSKITKKSKSSLRIIDSSDED